MPQTETYCKIWNIVSVILPEVVLLSTIKFGIVSVTLPEEVLLTSIKSGTVSVVLPEEVLLIP